MNARERHPQKKGNASAVPPCDGGLKLCDFNHVLCVLFNTVPEGVRKDASNGRMCVYVRVYCWMFWVSWIRLIASLLRAILFREMCRSPKDLLEKLPSKHGEVVRQNSVLKFWTKHSKIH